MTSFLALIESSEALVSITYLRASFDINVMKIERSISKFFPFFLIDKSFSFSNFDQLPPLTTNEHLDHPNPNFMEIFL